MNTALQTMTDNELIAEFMGQSNLTRVMNGKIVPYIPSYKIWQTLMPVVEKIKNIGYDSTMIICGLPNEKDKMMIHTTTDIISEQTGDSLIDSVYKAVVEFIKFYNNTNK